MPNDEFDIDDPLELNGMAPDAEGKPTKKYLAGNSSGKDEGGDGATFE